MFEFAPDAYLITDRNGTIRRANRAAARLLDIEPHALLGKPLVVFIGKAQRTAFRSRLGQLTVTQASEVREWRTTVVSRSNRMIPVSITVDASSPGKGQPMTVRWLIRDNTASYQAEQAAAEKREAFEALFDASPEATITLGPTGRITMWNAAAERLLGWSSWDMIGKPLRLSVNEEDRFKPVNVWQELQRTGSFPRGWALRIQTAAGTVVDASLLIGGLIDANGGLRGCVVIISDMSERTRVAETQSRTDQHLRQLLQRLQQSREEERRRMARDIHDHMGQGLTHLSFDLARLRQQLKSAEQTNALTELDRMQQAVRELTQITQRVSAELRPAILDDLGLTAAIEWQANEFSKRTGIACPVDVVAENALPGEGTTITVRVPSSQWSGS